MQRLVQQSLPDKMTTYTGLANLVANSYNHRNVMLSQMSGYPIPSHVIAQLHSRIKLTSMKALYQSLVEVRNLARLAADILNTIYLANIGKQQLSRAEVTSYIKANAAAFGEAGLADASRTADLEFVAYLITSSETSEASWTLSFADTATDNIYLAFKKLYASVVDAEADAMHVYNPIQATVTPIRDLPRYVAERKEAAGKKDVLAAIDERLTALQAPAQLAQIRVIDHMFMLMNDIGVWENFISARKSTDPSQNIERANSLKLFAAYVHSILMYYHFWQIESFMSVYRSLEEWVVTFPAIPSHIMHNYNTIVKNHDMLGAAKDANSVMAALTQDRDNTLGVKVIALPTEYVNAFGFKDILARVKQAMEKAQLPTNPFHDLSVLGGDTFGHLLLAHPVTTFDLLQDWKEVINMEGLVTEEIKSAVAGVMPALNKYWNDALMDNLGRLSIGVPFPLTHASNMVPEIMKSTVAEIKSGALHYESHMPLASYELEQYVRKDMALKIFDARTKDFVDKYYPQFVINHDQAKKLRAIIGTEFRSLTPSQYATGDRTYTAAALRADSNLVKNLLETITNYSSWVITRNLYNPYIRKVWATYFSSFCSLYIVPKDQKLGELITKAGSMANMFVTGYGKPYGVTYRELVTLQGEIKSEEEFVPIVDEVSSAKDVVAYMRFHKRIPHVTDTLTVETDFYLERKRYYFKGSLTAKAGETEAGVPVSKWVLADGLLHMTRIPLRTQEDAPTTLLDKRYAYMNNYLVLQSDLRYNVEASIVAGKSVSVAPAEREWKQDRYDYFITHNTYGSYATGGVTNLAVEASESKVGELISKAEKELQNTEQQAAPHMKVTEASGQVIKSSDVAKLKEGNPPLGSDSKSDKPKNRRRKGKKKDDSKPADKSTPSDDAAGLDKADDEIKKPKDEDGD